MRRAKKENAYAFGAAFFTFAIYFLHICQKVDINISLDEIGTFASASALAGYDWSGVLPLTRYYGYGFYWIFAGLFRITDSPYVIYITIYVMDCIILSLVAVLIYKIQVRELNLPNSVTTVFFAVLPGVVYSIVNYTYLTNDVMVYAVFWIIMYFLLKLLGDMDKSRKSRYSIFLAFFSCYILTMHERAIVIFGEILVLLVVWKVFVKKDIVNWKAFLISIVIFYIVARASKELVIALFWSDIEAETLANTSVIYKDLFWFTDSVRMFKIIIDIFVSNIIKAGMATYGIFFIGIALVFMATIMLIKKKGAITKILQSDPMMEKVVIICIVSIVAILITMAGLAVQWGNGAWTGLISGLGMGKSIRAYAYLRYYVVYIGPILISVYKLCIEERLEKGYYRVAFVILAGVLYYFLTEIDTYIAGQSRIVEQVNIFENYMFNRHISVLVVIVSILLLATFKKKNSRAIFVAMCSLLIIISNMPENFGFIKLESSRCDATRKYIKGLDQDGEWKNHLYVLDDSGNYQFFLNRHTPRVWNNEPEGVILAHANLEEICLNASYYRFDVEMLCDSECVQLDENEYVYILGDILEER